MVEIDQNNLFFIDLSTQRQELIEWIKKTYNDVKVIIAFSGGKDSIAMVLYCLFVLKLPKEQIELWHHEVDGHGEQLFDWLCTRSYCKAFAKAFGLRLLFSYAKGGILREIYKENEFSQPIYYQKEPGGQYFEILPRAWEKDRKTKLKFPAVSPDLTFRWCSWISKINVMQKAIINHWNKYTNVNICLMTGERRDESRTRAKYNEIEASRVFSQTRKSITWRSVIDMSHEEVWNMLATYKIQPHPAYEMGWSRCSCQLCIFSSANTWAANYEICPEKIVRIAEIEEDLKQKGSTHPYLYGDKIKSTGERMNIYQAKVNKGRSFIRQDIKDRWLDELLGEFTSPIIVDNWKLPLGALSKEESGAN